MYITLLSHVRFLLHPFLYSPLPKTSKFNFIRLFLCLLSSLTTQITWAYHAPLFVTPLFYIFLLLTAWCSFICSYLVSMALIHTTYGIIKDKPHLRKLKFHSFCTLSFSNCALYFTEQRIF